MRFDLKEPCKHCPFGVAETRIRFASPQRAAEIEETAYRFGFPCHQSAVLVEEDDWDSDMAGYVPGPNSQHCAGSIFMLVNEGHDCWPGIGNEELAPDYLARIAPKLHLAFESSDAFVLANGGR